MPFHHARTAKKKKNFVDRIISNAKQLKKLIAFPESLDPRILDATKFLVSKKITRVALIGDPNKIKLALAKKKIPIRSVVIFDIDEDVHKYAKQLYTLRKKKGMTLEKATQLLSDPMYYATMLLKNDFIDGIVYGASHPSADTFRPALQIIKTAKNVSLVSSYFAMLHEGSVYFYADCGFVINPDKNQLAQIAISTNDTAKSFGFKPKVAMLSCSTKGSAHDPIIQKVVDATAIVKRKRKDIIIDGEFQFDAAVIPSVAKSKAAGSAIKGDANILIFPDLNSGNISYKISQRFAHDKPIGPITQGFAKPVNDLSRGCTVEEVIEVAAMTAIQAK